MLSLPGAHRTWQPSRAGDGSGVLAVRAWRGAGAPILWRTHAPSRAEAEARLIADAGTIAAAYADAHHPAARETPQTLGWLLELWQQSPEWAGLAASTRDRWGRCAGAVPAALRGLRLATLADPRARGPVLAWRDTMADRPRTADYHMQVLSAALGWGVQRGHLARNILDGLPGLYRPEGRAHVVWLPHEIEAACAAATPALARAIRLAVATGLRRGDLIALRWDEVHADRIERRTRKSRGRASAVIPMTPALRAALDACPREAVTVLTSGLHRPWTADGLGASFGRLPRPAGKRWHDLRGTYVCRRIADGATPAEVALEVGWSVGSCDAIWRTYASSAGVVALRTGTSGDRGS